MLQIILHTNPVALMNLTTLKVTTYQNATKKRDVNTNVQPENFQKIAEENLSHIPRVWQSVPGYDTKIMILKKKSEKLDFIEI